uniref:DNA-directed DNA polymerase n=1 Tax=Pithovirus LCPAC202 TaxID=2506592 RepID=A0A481Z803_9VIRU|nr:MAG: DNA polymerase family X [Pithovirus LCPAC202]
MEPFQSRPPVYPSGSVTIGGGVLPSVNKQIRFPRSENEKILILAFQEMAKLYGKLSEKYRQRAFETAAEILSNYPHPIPTGSDLRNIGGIGESSAKVVEEWFRTGKIQRLEDLRKRSAKLERKVTLVIKSPEIIQKENAIKLFQTIHGVGPKIAEKWYLKGWRTMNDIKIDELNHAQLIGFQNLTELKEKIPRAEIDLFQTYLDVMLLNVPFQICGSYRRGTKESGDIDVLLMETERYTLSYIVNEMTKRNLIIDQLSLGQTKFMGTIKLSPIHKKRRLDLRWVPKDVWAFATLYFTGCGELNIKMRRKAIIMGLKLNEYCLTKSSGEIVACPSEEAIFAALEMVYLPPTERSATENN